MFPDVNLFGKNISFYAIFALIGILSVFVFHQWYCKKKGYDEIFMLFLLLFSVIGVVVGGHLLYSITMHDYIVAFFENIHTIGSFKEFLDYFVTIFGGSVYYGGLLGGIFVAAIYLKKQKFDVDPYIGIGTLCIPLFHFFGRIGCFMSGCCYGIESQHGLYFNYSVAPGCSGVKRIPVQLIEAGVELLLFLILFFLFDKKKQTGKFIFNSYMISYAIARFFIEFLRGDTYRGFIGVFSTSQFISILILVFYIVYGIIFIMKYRHDKGNSKENI